MYISNVSSARYARDARRLLMELTELCLQHFK